VEIFSPHFPQVTSTDMYKHLVLNRIIF